MDHTPVKFVVVLVRRPDLTAEEFQRYLKTVHEPMALVLPDLIGERLSDAEARLAERAIPFRVERLETVVPARSARVCDQEPAPGVRAVEVTLFAARECTPPPPAEHPPPVVPSVVGEDLDDAELALDGAGLDYVVEPSGSGPVVAELWEVCAQAPRAGRRAWTVVLHARDDCS